MNHLETVVLNRRDLLAGSAVALAALAFADQAAAEEHPDHASHAGHAAPGGPVQAVIDSALDCQKKGQACVAHCLQSFKAGDLSLAQCAASVEEMLAICGALANLAALGSAQLKKTAMICAEICEACEKECRKHDSRHPTCKACADACAECLRACKALPT